jgi:hypothetical protein
VRSSQDSTLYALTVTSHMMTWPSFDAEASMVPLWENLTYHTSSECSVSTCTLSEGNWDLHYAYSIKYQIYGTSIEHLFFHPCSVINKGHLFVKDNLLSHCKHWSHSVLHSQHSVLLVSKHGPPRFPKVISLKFRCTRNQCNTIITKRMCVCVCV